MEQLQLNYQETKDIFYRKGKNLMKKSKIFSILIIVTLLMASLSSKASENMISQKELDKQIKNLCTKYDVEVSLSHNEGFVTEKEATDYLTQLENAFSKPRNSTMNGKLSDIQPYFNYQKNYSAIVRAINTPLTFADIEISCTGTIYDGKITFQSISNIHSRQYGYGAGFVSWTQKSSSSTISSDKKTAQVSVVGTLVTQYTILGRTDTYTYDQVVGMNIRAAQ